MIQAPCVPFAAPSREPLDIVKPLSSDVASALEVPRNKKASPA